MLVVNISKIFLGSINRLQIRDIQHPMILQQQQAAHFYLAQLPGTGVYGIVITELEVHIAVHF